MLQCIYIPNYIYIIQYFLQKRYIFKFYILQNKLKIISKGDLELNVHSSDQSLEKEKRVSVSLTKRDKQGIGYSFHNKNKNLNKRVIYMHTRDYHALKLFLHLFNFK